ncbi:MAG: DUF4936 family protein [Burkholderiales bacterium]
MVHYYVWYRVTGDATAARAAVDALLHGVFRHAGVTGRVLVRRDDPRTWMEVYEHVADVALFERELAAAVARRGVGRHVEGGVRHTEPFLG